MDRVYILSMQEFMNITWMEQDMEDVLQLVDEDRRRKVHAARRESAKSSSLGTGLLLQYALSEASAEAGADEAEESAEDVVWRQVTYSRLLEKLQAGGEAGAQAQPLSYIEICYGPHGKPYLKDSPLYFNLSHSGEYAVCAISEKEIGVDIQQHRDMDVIKLAERFFHEREADVLKKCDSFQHQKKLFYDLWAKKEAYGKWTGRGVAEVLGRDIEDVCSLHAGMVQGCELCKGESMECGLGMVPQTVVMETYEGIQGYSIAVCTAK